MNKYVNRNKKLGDDSKNHVKVNFFVEFEDGCDYRSFNMDKNLSNEDKIKKCIAILERQAEMPMTTNTRPVSVEIA